MRWIAVLLVAGLALGGCTLPGGAAGGAAYHVSADFTDVLDLVPAAAVKVNDVTVGAVEAIRLVGWTARVRLRIERGVRLPANAVAEIRQTSLLGEKFVALAAPAGVPATGTLADGALIPVSRTGRTVEVEEVLAAFGLLLGGGGLSQLKTINDELSAALRGRESTVDDLLHQLDTFLAGLDSQRAQIVRAIDALDGLSAHLARQRGTLDGALTALQPGLSTLAEQREQLTGALTALSRLSTVGTRVVNGSRDATLASLAALRPLLTQLVRAGADLPKALEFLLTYPFPPNVTGAIHGNAVNLHVTLDLNGAAILGNLVAAGPVPASKPPAGRATPGAPGLLGDGGVLPGPAPSASPAPGAGPPTAVPPSDCPLLDFLLGRCPS
ncbi:MAG: MCE family protein [Micromonosporaceae bacterium]|nr:MCE family protein [Micromonosporaceae bacterium]